MSRNIPTLRFAVIFLILLSGTAWSLALAGGEKPYPNAELLASADWLAEHADDPHLTIVDVRNDDHFDGRLIPGAIRIPWSLFRYNDTSDNTASRFVGAVRSQEILGRHGVGRTDTVILYDSVERDGGATASYVFWVLDVLGHKEKKILHGGIDAWERSGRDLASRPRQPGEVLYQAMPDEIRAGNLIDGDFVYDRLGDRYYQIIDVRSAEEYAGKAGTRGLQGEDLKLGHVPTAVNINYTDNWVDSDTKRIKPYKQLQALYQGLDPARAVIVYCNSGRRSSFSYFVLRLMGIPDVLTYEASWKEWGNPEKFYPVENRKRVFHGQGLPATGMTAPSGPSDRAPNTTTTSQTTSSTDATDAPKSGYVSCGG